MAVSQGSGLSKISCISIENEAWWGGVIVLSPSLWTSHHLCLLIAVLSVAALPDHWTLSFLQFYLWQPVLCSLSGLPDSPITLLKFKEQTWKTMKFCHRLSFLLALLGTVEVYCHVNIIFWIYWGWGDCQSHERIQYFEGSSMNWKGICS